jgi:hypothetical protein
MWKTVKGNGIQNLLLELVKRFHKYSTKKRKQPRQRVYFFHWLLLTKRINLQKTVLNLRIKTKIIQWTHSRLILK